MFIWDFLQLSLVSEALFPDPCLSFSGYVLLSLDYILQEWCVGGKFFEGPNDQSTFFPPCHMISSLVNVKFSVTNQLPQSCNVPCSHVVQYDFSTS